MNRIAFFQEVLDALVHLQGVSSYDFPKTKITDSNKYKLWSDGSPVAFLQILFQAFIIDPVRFR